MDEQTLEGNFRETPGPIDDELIMKEFGIVLCQKRFKPGK